MSPFFKTVIRSIMEQDTSLLPSERTALAQFLAHGTIHFTEIPPGSLLLPAIKAAELLGVSTETFKKIRDQAREECVLELCGVETTPGSYMYSRLALVRFSHGELLLNWHGAGRVNHLSAVALLPVSSTELQSVS